MSQPALLKCPCGMILAERLGDVWIIRHAGRKFVARELVTIECERCHRSWGKETPATFDTTANLIH